MTLRREREFDALKWIVCYDPKSDENSHVTFTINTLQVRNAQINNLDILYD